MLVLEEVGEKLQTQRGLCLPVKYWIHDGSMTDKIRENICTFAAGKNSRAYFSYD